MSRRQNIAAFAGAAVLFAGAAPGAPVAGRPELFEKLVECRSIADAAARLACYDTQVSALDVAEKKKDVVMMDRQQVRETRKSLFGFTLPHFSLGGSKVDEKDDITRIESTIVSVHRIANGWAFTLANDAGNWETGDPLSNAPPRMGDKVEIKKAAMGSFLGTIGFTHGVRFRRVG